MAVPDKSRRLPPFEAPGPGFWALDLAHFPRPLTRYFQSTHAPAYRSGSHEFARFYGLLIDGLQIGYVNGFAYRQLLPVPESSAGPGANSCMTGTRCTSPPPSASTANCRPSTRMPCPMPHWLTT